MSRKSISLTTKLASALLALGDIPYVHAKQMTAAQVVSLYQFDHGILHETRDPDVDKFWNLTPRLIREHRTKTKLDAKIIAKGRRIRDKHSAVRTPKLRIGTGEGMVSAYGVLAASPRPSRSRIQSRGFDKRLRKKMDGTVVPR